MRIAGSATMRQFGTAVAWPNRRPFTIDSPDETRRQHWSAPSISAGPDLKPQQPLAEFFASQLINLEWLERGNGEHPKASFTGGKCQCL